MLFVILTFKGTSNAVIILTMMFSFRPRHLHDHVRLHGRSQHPAPVHRHCGQRDQPLGCLPDGLFPPCSATGSTCTISSVIFYFLAGISLLGCCVAIVIYLGRALRSVRLKSKQKRSSGYT